MRKCIILKVQKPLDSSSKVSVKKLDVKEWVRTKTGSVLTDAIDILTEAARLRRPVYRQTDAGKWKWIPGGPNSPTGRSSSPSPWPAPQRTSRASPTCLPAGQSSWEAAGVESLLGSTVGPDEGICGSTAPSRSVSMSAAKRCGKSSPMMLRRRGTSRIDAEQDAELDALGDPIDWDALCWKYTIPENGDPSRNPPTPRPGPGRGTRRTGSRKGFRPSGLNDFSSATTTASGLWAPTRLHCPGEGRRSGGDHRGLRGQAGSDRPQVRRPA